MRVGARRANRWGGIKVRSWWLLFLTGFMGSIVLFAAYQLKSDPSKELLSASKMQYSQQNEEQQSEAYMYELQDGKLHRVSMERPEASNQIIKEERTGSSETTGTDKANTGTSLGQKPAASQKPQASSSSEQAGGGTDTGTKQDQENAEANHRWQDKTDLTIQVYLTKEKKVESVPLETYVLGVLAGEMPIDFEIEALKAQAIAARTYAIRRLELGRDEQMEKLGADVMDTIRHQVYVSKKELEQRWEGETKKRNLEKLQLAVDQTRGEVVTYKGAAIEASFFSTSNGYTENAEDYWGSNLPYLRSVASPWDEQLSPRFEQQFTFTREELYKRLGLKGKEAGKKLTMKVIEKSEGKRIKTMTINGVKFSGREVREKLELASSEFTWKIGKKEIVFYTQGYGHGVGMSQWGANGMALEGKSAAQIIHYYYSDVEIEQASKLSIAQSS